jgi:hypothetical protein
MANAPRASSFNVENPRRVVIDIPGVRLQAPGATRNEAVDSSPLVRRLRIAQNTLNPPLVRVVLEVDAFPEVDVSSSAAGLAIRVTPAP